MKLARITLFSILSLLITAESVYAQPLEYQGRSDFCHRVMQYTKQKPVFKSHRRSAKKSPYSMTRRNPQVQLTRNLPSINSVFIRGGVNLQILGGQSKSKIKLKANYPGVSVSVCNGAICISYSKPVDCNQNPRPSIKLYVNQLRQLEVAGDSCIMGNNLNDCCGLTIYHCGCGSVCLSGPVNLIRVVNTGGAVICIPNVVSEHVHILATRTSVLRLGGSTNLLLIRAFQHATVDTRFMCSDRAMVQAADESLVTVRTFGDLRAFANGMSNIYYYTKPGDLLKHNVLSGNVFQMGGYCY